MHFMFSNVSSKNRAVHEIMWNNKVEPDRPRDSKTRRCALYAR